MAADRANEELDSSPQQPLGGPRFVVNPALVEISDEQSALPSEPIPIAERDESTRILRLYMLDNVFEEDGQSFPLEEYIELSMKRNGNTSEIIGIYFRVEEADGTENIYRLRYAGKILPVDPTSGEPPHFGWELEDAQGRVHKVVRPWSKGTKRPVKLMDGDRTLIFANDSNASRITIGESTTLYLVDERDRMYGVDLRKVTAAYVVLHDDPAIYTAVHEQQNVILPIEEEYHYRRAADHRKVKRYQVRTLPMAQPERGQLRSSRAQRRRSRIGRRG